jgi:hypothetical protein
MNYTRARGLVIASIVLILTGTTFSAVIENINGLLESTDWYHGNGDYFKPNYAGGEDDAQINILGFYTEGEPVPNYYMYYGDFAMGQSALVEDLSGEFAHGVFASGATLTISGDLWRDFGDYDVAASGDLIIAEVTAQWELRELPPNAPANTVNGRAFFHITGGALSNPSLNNDGLIMGDFYLDFTFQPTTPAVTDFSTLLGNATYNCNNPTIQGGAVPEPTSIALLALGGLALIRKRR